MPRTKQNKRSDKIEHSFVSIRVASFDICSRASVNHQVENPKYAFEPLCKDDLVYNHITSLKVCGEATQISEHAGARYELTINGEDGPHKRVNLTLGDIQARSEHGSPKYREYRGRTIPVVEPVPGIAFLDRNRDGVWTAWINVLPRLASDMMAILNAARPTWISLHETRNSRNRWIRDISVQTTNPEEE